MNRRLITELEAICSAKHVLSGAADLICYGKDATWKESRPDVVVLPGSAAEVAAVMSLANREGVPVTPRGAGTGLAAGCLPVHGGIVLSLTRLNRILEIDRRNMYAVVEPGVITAELQRQVEAVNLFYPPDPSSGKVSTLGGNIGCNAGGARCFKYGVTGDYVLGLEVVLPSGAIVQTGGRTVKNVTGYNLTQLIVGSEGTLGIVTKATLRLVPKPESKRTLLAVFDRLVDAGEAIAEVVASGVVPCSMELMDQASIRVVEDYLHLGLPVDAEALLLIEVDGYRETVKRQTGEVAAICLSARAISVREARDAQEADELWRARKSISAALTRIKPTKMSEDIVVPPAKVVQFFSRFQQLREESGLTMALFGHAGDGNLHPSVVTDFRDANEMQRVHLLLADLAKLALELGGTLSGEHGIGTLKAPFLHWELGEAGLDLMRAIKRALDPNNILNPGKMQLDSANLPSTGRLEHE